MIVLVPRVDVAHPGRRAGPQSVELEVLVAPVATDPAGHRPHILQRLRIRHIEAGAAPVHFEGFAVQSRKQELLVGKERVVPRPRERHEPNPRRQAKLLDLLRRLRHSGRIRPIRAVRGEVASRAVELLARLPAIVDLDDREAERRQVLARKFRVLQKVPLIRGPRMVPRAVDRRLRRQLDTIVPGNGVGVGLQAQAGIVEVPDQQPFGLDLLPGLHQQSSVVQLGLDDRLAVFDIREQQAAAPLVGEPACHDALAALRIGHRQKRVAPGIRFARDAVRPAVPRARSPLASLGKPQHHAHGADTAESLIRI